MSNSTTSSEHAPQEPGEAELAAARDALRRFDQSVRPGAATALREWRRFLRGSPDPLPDSYLAHGAEIAGELVRLTETVRALISTALAGTHPAWADPLHAVEQQTREWIAAVSAPCLDVAACIADVSLFLLSTQDIIGKLDERLAMEIAGRRDAPPWGSATQPGVLQLSQEEGAAQVRQIRSRAESDLVVVPTGEPNQTPERKRKGGRPPLKSDKTKEAIARDVAELHGMGGTLQQACEAVAKVYGRNLKCETVRTWIRKFGLGRLRVGTKAA